MNQSVLAAVFLIVALIPCLSFAGDHKGTKSLASVNNETYTKNCGSCHFAYQPGLLPARSWLKVLEQPGSHVGGNLSLDKKDMAEIKSYLEHNSAEQSSSKRSRKILGSIGSDTPVRISEIPYIKVKHRKIAQDVFMRKAIGSRSNCVACHKSAAGGVYEGDDVVIPK